MTPQYIWYPPPSEENASLLNILAHTLHSNLKSCYEVNQYLQRVLFCSFSLYCAIQKRSQGAGQNCVPIGAYHVVQTLYW